MQASASRDCTLLQGYTFQGGILGKGTSGTVYVALSWPLSLYYYALTRRDCAVSTNLRNRVIRKSDDHQGQPPCRFERDRGTEKASGRGKTSHPSVTKVMHAIRVLLLYWGQCHDIVHTHAILAPSRA